MPAIDTDLTLTAPGGETLALSLERVDADDTNVEIDVLADPIVWARIDAGALLHLDPAAGGPLLGGAFAGPVRIRAVLDATVAALLDDPDASEIAARLRDGEPGDRLHDECSWWALTATADVEPPPGLEGELRTGLETIWQPDPPPAGMATVIAAALEQADIAPSVEATDDGDWIVRFQDAGAIGLAIAREAAGQAIVYFILPRICPPERRAELARLTALASFDLPIGCLEADLGTGQARIRVSADVSGDRLTLAAARNLVAAGRHLATAWLPAVERVIDGSPAGSASA